MKLSIFTPSHDAAFLPQVYHSIQDQCFDEWVVLLNGDADYKNNDPRVRIIRDDTGHDYVGYLKWKACQLCTGDILLELDHDDLLMPKAVNNVFDAFVGHPETVFAYSNCLHSSKDFNPTERYSEAFGWKYRAGNYQGYALDEYLAFDPTPAAVSRIWYAPNHVRAFRRTTYDAIGGHSRKMRVLDDQDLMCRMYLQGKFAHLNEPLYVYRIHGENSWLKNNGEIQNNVVRLYDQYIEDMAMKWAGDSGLLKLDLGGRMFSKPGLTTVDLKDAEIIADLTNPWPFEDNSVGMVRAYDVFEHLPDSLHTMKELYRVLAPGGYAFIQVPSTDGRGAFQDPTHRSFWNENSFQYYTARSKGAYIDCPVRFQSLRCYTTEMNADKVCWTRAHLLKLVDGMRVPGIVAI